MPFPLVVVPPAGCWRWSCLGLLLQVRAQLQTNDMRPEELDKLFRPLLAELFLLP
jgi:hypothetical protein